MTRGKQAALAARDQAKKEGRIWLTILPLFAIIYWLSPWAETAYFPVVTEAEILSAEDVGGGWTRLEVQAEKLRDCDWQSVEWFFGPRAEGGPRVPARFDDAPTQRGLGRLHWDKLMVRLPEDLIRSNSHGDVLHRCYGPNVSATRSRYYTSP